MNENKKISYEELMKLLAYVLMPDDEFCEWLLDGATDEDKEEFIEEFPEYRKDEELG